ncbi:MAG TPA: DedA family protein [Bacteroidia bacterium]|nr:DedA family protein [Bacteroidia bacterium]HRS58393.1 DedA family protein [Bacteroidia bacterium]HRU67343.1 DedA family protein [Bacteroidia bacterium]
MGITEFIATYVTDFIDKTGYITILIGMTMESMVFPVPSEAVMPFAGFLIAESRFTFAGVIGFSTLGSLIGSYLSYLIGRYGGEPFINKFGKYLLLDHEELEITNKFFSRYGQLTVFISRFIPVVRHLISIPAGIAKMNLFRFMLLTLIGAGMWNAFLAWCGYYLRQRWHLVMEYSHVVDIVVLVILVLLFLMFVYRQYRKYTKRRLLAK